MKKSEKEKIEKEIEYLHSLIDFDKYNHNLNTIYLISFMAFTTTIWVALISFVFLISGTRFIFPITLGWLISIIGVLFWTNKKLFPAIQKNINIHTQMLKKRYGFLGLDFIQINKEFGQIWKRK